MNLSSDSPSPSGPLPKKTTLLRRVRRSVVAAIIGLLLVGMVVVVLAYRRPKRTDTPVHIPAADPRLIYAGPFRNIHPRIGYVGDASCRGCHPDISRSYAEHPMGRSLARLEDRPDLLAQAESAADFTSFSSRFHVERHGEQMRQRQTRLDAAGQPIYTLDHDVRYVLGSGTRGYSFLAEREGFLFQTPISWFRQQRVWGLSPGFTPALFPGRPVAAECLFCHANRARSQSDTVNGYETPIFEGHAIGCERCHGPGERHVQERTQGIAVAEESDFTIVNPSAKQDKKRVLSPQGRDAICEQCHLSGEARVLRLDRDWYDFRPGLPAHLFWTVFVRDHRTDEDEKAVNHVEQMHRSRCYLQSTGAAKLECLSCHDPHATIPEPRRVQHYRNRCLHCHGERGCTVPEEVRRREAKDSCIACHMPRYSTSDIPHTAATDHRIVRPRTPPDGNKIKNSSVYSIVPFYNVDTEDRELARGRAIALVRLAEEGKGEPEKMARQAVDLLQEALAFAPDDVPAWEARGTALTVLKRSSEALSAFETALVHAPGREISLRAAAQLAQESGQLEKALNYWRRAVQSNPQTPDSHGNLALLLAHSGAWEEASAHCQTWLRLDPGSLQARRLWIRCLRQQGDRQAARIEMDRLQRLRE